MSAQTFDFGQAVFHFFSVAGRKPAGVLWIALWQALLTAGLVYIAFLTVGDFYLWLLTEVMAGSEPTESEFFARLGGVMSVLPLISVGGMLIALMAQAAWLRLLTRGEMAAIIPFRLGGDELRLFVTNLGLLAFAIAFYIASLLITLVLAGGAMAAVAGEGSSEAGLAGGLFVALLFIALLVAAVFFALRLSAAPATTILEKRIAFPAWGMTRGIVWPLLGAYILVAIIIAVVSTVIGTVLNLTLLGALLPVIGEFAAMAETSARTDMEEVLALMQESLSRPGVLGAFIAIGLLSIILRSFTDAIWHSVGASVAVQRGAASEAG